MNDKNFNYFFKYSRLIAKDIEMEQLKKAYKNMTNGLTEVNNIIVA